MVKYNVTYKDDLGNTYECLISNADFTGQPTNVRGNCVVDYPKIENIYQVIRGSGMRLTLEASTDLNLEDLYGDGEKEFEVSLTRNGNTIFKGFIDPAGLSEDLVNDKWEVTLDCVDGLALLENLSYVDEDGFPYFGKLSDIETINNCLRRTGLFDNNGNNLLVVSSINTRYNNLPVDECPLRNVYSNQDRFYKDDGETIMSCRDVLESTLRKYGGCIMQADGNWNIFSFYELLGPDRYFYTYAGNFFQFSQIKNYDNLNIQTDALGVLPYWTSGNQRKEILPPVGAVKLSYKYGFVKTLILNGDLENDGVEVFDWQIINGDSLTLINSGIRIGVSGFTVEVLESTPFQSAVGDNLSITFDLKNGNTLEDRGFVFRLKATLSSDTATFYINGNGDWVSDSNARYESEIFVPKGSDFIHTVNTSSAPIEGDVRIIILNPDETSSDGAATGLTYKKVSVTGKVDESLQGETHTQQVSGKNTRVPEVIELSVGDNPSDIYLGAIYESDEVTNTEFWKTVFTPNDIVNPQSILEILSEFISVYRKQPSYLVSGDVRGYINPLSLFSLDLVPNKTFTLASYSFDTKAGITTTEFMELKRSSYFGNSYEFALDYGNVTKPTIVG